LSNCLKHPNGRGRLEGDAQVSRDCRIGRDCVVRGSAVVRDGAVLEGRCIVEGDSVVLSGYYLDTYIGPGPFVSASGPPSPFVAGGHFENCRIMAGVQIAGRPNVTGSVLACKRISGEPVIDNCRLLGQAEVFDSPTLEGVELNGSAWVYGSAVLKGPLTLDKMARVERGYWDRAPKSSDFGYVSMTESKGGCLIDCRYRSFSDWLKNAARIARRRAFVVGSLNDELIADVLAVVAEWQREQGVQV
jgi:hypothetical protein